MSEVQVSAEPIGLRYRCDSCGEGEMLADLGKGMQLVDPPKYPNKCNQCAAEAYLSRAYPDVAYRIGPIETEGTK